MPDLPPVVTRLNLFASSKKEINPGKYLVCVYGDEFIGKTSFSLSALPAITETTSTSEVRVDEITSCSITPEHTIPPLTLHHTI